MNIWYDVDKSLLYKNEGKRKQLANKLIKEIFPKYIAHKYLPRSFNDPGYLEAPFRPQYQPELLKLLLKYSVEANGNKPITILEIGSFMGLSAKYMVREIESMGPISKGLKIHSVDLMRGYYEELSTMQYSNQAFHLIYNTENERLKNKIILHAGKSTEILPSLCLKANFCYIDGEHTSGGVYADLALSLGQITYTGLLLVDDVSWKDKDARSVVYGILTFIKKYRKNIITMFALGVKDGKYGFFEVKTGEDNIGEVISSFKTKQLLIVARRKPDIKLEKIMKEISEEKLYLS